MVRSVPGNSQPIVGDSGRPGRKPPRSEVITRADGRVYLRRWRLWRGRFFSVCLHRFMAPDESECAHDHPWPFVSLVLWGGYVEEVWPDGDSAAAVRVRRGLFSLASRDALHCHRVVACRPGWTWTLVLTGPRRRSWGFRTRAGGWVPEERFDAAVDC